jgi:hypothetical protein
MPAITWLAMNKYKVSDACYNTAETDGGTKYGSAEAIISLRCDVNSAPQFSGM